MPMGIHIMLFIFMVDAVISRSSHKARSLRGGYLTVVWRMWQPSNSCRNKTALLGSLLQLEGDGDSANDICQHNLSPQRNST